MHKKPSGEWIMAYTAIDDPSDYFRTGDLYLVLVNAQNRAVTDG